MNDTPFFVAWRSRLAPLGQRTRRVLQTVRQCTLSQIESSLGPWLALPELQAPSARSSRRERPYSVRRTFWCFMWQMLNLNASCREVARQLQAALGLRHLFDLDESNSAYVQARQRLPQAVLEEAFARTAQVAERLSPSRPWLQGRPLKAADATTLTLADTPANQRQYPQPGSQRRGCGFPLMRLSVLFSVQSGALLHTVSGSYYAGEMRLFQSMRPALHPKDVLIYDRAAGNYIMAATTQLWGVDLISRVAHRRPDFRRGRRLGAGDRLMIWKKSSKKPNYLTAEQWAQFPDQMVVRVIKVRLTQKGARSRLLILLTTLLDPVLYPADQIAQAYLQRWRLELCFDDLKTTLRMDTLRCQTPPMVHKELRAFCIAYNLLRCLMAQAAQRHGVDLCRISFKGTLDAFRHFSAAMAQAGSAKHRRQIWEDFLRTLAADLVPLRPNRTEPRAVKRRPKSYPRLNAPRHQYRGKGHRTYYQATPTN